MSNDPNDSDPRRTGQLSRDPERIQEWAREHDVVPVRVDDAGAGERFRMVPESEMTEETERIEWEQFEDELDTGEEVVIYHGAEAEEPLEVRGHSDVLTEVDEADLEERLLEGETVETQITETRVVESVVVEELDVESELVETEILEDRVTDVQLLDLQCTRCDLEEVEGEDARDWFDTERYLDAVGDVARHGEPAGEGARTIDDVTGEIDADDVFPYRGDLEVEETWAITREFRERHEVESRIVGKEVTESDTIEDYDVDVNDLHRSIVDQGVFETERPQDEVLTHYDAESEIAGDDTILTTFEREHTVEDEIVDRKRFDADLVNGQYLGMDLLQSRPVDEGRTTTAGGTTGTATTGAEPSGATAASNVELTEDVVGHDVVDAGGDKIGVVTDVDEAAGALYVDPGSGITEKIMTRLGWGGADEDDYRLQLDDVSSITDDEVRLASHEGVDDGGETR